MGANYQCRPSFVWQHSGRRQRAHGTRFSADHRTVARMESGRRRRAAGADAAGARRAAPAGASLHGRERAGHPLQTTALVNEAYLRLVDSSRVRWQNRAHFFAVSAQLMRRILVDIARARHKLKRGGDALTCRWTRRWRSPTSRGPTLIALDDALKTLAAIDAAKEQGRGASVLRRVERRGDGGDAGGVAGSP